MARIPWIIAAALGAGSCLAVPTLAHACPRGGGATAGVTGKDRINLGADVNAWFNNCEAQISADGQTLYFNYHHGNSGGRGGVYRARWDGAAWGEPELLVEGGSMPTVTRDESRVFFGLGPGMQVIERAGDGFGPPRALQWDGATPRGMGTAAVSADGNMLVLNGNSDLYLSRRNPATDTWSTPELLGLPISGSGIEWHPFLTYDGTRLLYDTTSPEIIGVMEGGEFSSYKMVEARWDEATQSFGTPRIIGEFGCSMSETEDGKELYYGGRFEGGRGALDIWTEKLEGVTREPVEVRPAAGPPAGSRWCSLGRLPDAVSVGAVVPTAGGALVAVSSDGAVFRLADGGWTAVHSLTSSCLAHLHEDTPMVGAVALPDGTILAASPEGIARSTDGGSSWESATLPGGITGARALSAGPDGTVYAGGQDGKVLASEDGGATFWLRSDLGASIRALAVDASGTVHTGGVTRRTQAGPGSDSPVQRSTDGGGTFEAVAVTWGGGERPAVITAYSVLAPGPGALFVGVWMHGTEEASGVLRFANSALAPTSLIPGDWQDKRATALVQIGAVLYAGLATHESGDVVFASGDSGASWVSTGNLAPAREVFALAALSDGTVVAGTAPFGELFRLRASADDPCLPLPGGGGGGEGGGGAVGGAAGTGATDPAGEESGCGCATGNQLSLAGLLLAALGLRRARRRAR